MRRFGMPGILSAIIVLSIGLTPAHAQSAARTPDTELVTLIDRVTADFYKPAMIIALGPFTYGTTSLSSPFSISLQNELSAAILHSRSAKVLGRNVGATMDPAFKSQYDELLKQNQMDAFLHGSFFEEGEMVRIHLEMTDMSTNLTLLAEDILRPRRTIPVGVSLRPEIAVSAKAEELTHLIAPPPSSSGAESEALRVSVSTDKGNGGAYVDGEKLQILLTANKDAYVKIYHIDVYGQATLIYPNQFDPGRKIRAGSILRIPGGAAFELRLEPPHGTEFIKAVASTTPFLFTEADFATLGGDAVKIIGLGSQTAPARTGYGDGGGSGELLHRIAAAIAPSDPRRGKPQGGCMLAKTIAIVVSMLACVQENLLRAIVDACPGDDNDGVGWPGFFRLRRGAGDSLGGG